MHRATLAMTFGFLLLSTCALNQHLLTQLTS